jgi:hypothetical protein
MYLMNKVFIEYLDMFIIVFINGILVYSKSKEEHLCLVPQKLRDHRLDAKISKCEIWMKQVAFLSHFILEEVISVDSCKFRDMLC